MHGWQEFWNSMDWWRLLGFALSAAAVLLCMTVHEVSHGYAAYRLGDTTAKSMGRLSLNPLKHVDPIGALLLLFVGVGWAKPVSVDPRHFKNPKGGMALTALAGPVSNFLLAWVFLLLGGGALRVIDAFYMPLPVEALEALFSLARFLVNAAVLSVGLGLFNLFPIPPLDGAKVFFSLFPDRVYFTVLRYERYVMLLMLAAVWLGWLDKPLSFLITRAVNILGVLSAYPYPLF